MRALGYPQLDDRALASSLLIRPYRQMDMMI